MTATHLTVAPLPGADKPTIVIGFSSDEFSQAVYFQVSDDVQETVKFADMFYKAILEAAATAYKEYKHAESTGKASEEASGE